MKINDLAIPTAKKVDFTPDPAPAADHPALPPPQSRPLARTNHAPSRQAGDRATREDDFTSGIPLADLAAEDPNMRPDRTEVDDDAHAGGNPSAEFGGRVFCETKSLHPKRKSVLFVARRLGIGLRPPMPTLQLGTFAADPTASSIPLQP